MEHSFAPRIPGFNPLVGTASWSDKTLLDCGKFYPPTARTPEARLRFYASQFNLVEVDTSYYAIPAVTTAQHWAERTPPGFVFNVKAFSLFTGQWTSTDVLPKDIKEALGPGQRMVYKDMAVEFLQVTPANRIAMIESAVTPDVTSFNAPTSVVKGALATVSWTSVNTTHCTLAIFGDTSGYQYLPISGSQSVRIYQPTGVSVKCYAGEQYDSAGKIIGISGGGPID